MNLRDLQYLVAVAEHRHFGKAAKVCFVSQPALSMQIKKLEDTLGLPLLERNTKTVLLTKTGETIAAYAKNILLQVKEMQEFAKQAKDPYSGTLNLGIIPTLAPYLLPHIMPALGKAFPKLVFHLVEEQTAYLLEKLKQGKLDAAILALPITDNELTTTALFEEDFMLATPVNDQLAKRNKIKTSDLENRTLLLLEEGHCMRDQALMLCHKIHATEETNFRATSLETLRHMVIAKTGITLMPKLACLSNHNIAYIPFCTPKPTRQIGLVRRTTSTKIILLNDLADQIKKVINKMK